MSTIICTSCGKQGHDWMVDAELVPPHKAICGECKIEWGKLILGEKPDEAREALK